MRKVVGRYVVDVDTLAGAETQHYDFVIDVGRRKFFEFGMRGADVGHDVGVVCPATESVERRCRRSDAEVRNTSPASRIVTRVEARAAIVGYLVMFEAMLREERAELLILFSDCVVVERVDLVDIDHAGEHAAFFVGEGVSREMADIELKEAVDIGEKVEIFVRQSEYQIDTYVVDASRMEHIDRVVDFAGVVSAVEEVEHIVVEALNAEAYAVNLERGEERGQGRSDIFGVAFEGEFFDERSIEAGVDVRQESFDERKIEERGCTSAHIYSR